MRLSLYLQVVSSFKDVVNVSSVQWKFTAVQEVHHSLQTQVGHSNQLHLVYEQRSVANNCLLVVVLNTANCTANCTLAHMVGRGSTVTL